MFTPIGYFAPQGGAAGFDPTLGGTLTVNHWYDLTDSTTMTFSGANVTAISDKVGSYNITNAYNSGPTFIDAATGTYFNNQTLYETSTIPTTFGVGDVTYLTIFTRTGAYGGSIMRVWGLVSPWTSPYSRQDFQPAVIADFNVWSSRTVQSDSGQGGSDYIRMHDWDSVPDDYASGYYNVVTTNEVFFAGKSTWSGTTNAFNTSINGSTFGNQQTDNATVQTSTSYLELGARGSDNGLHQNRFLGYIKHCIVYNGALTDQNIADVYTAWTSL